MSKNIEIEPASINQFRKSLGGFVEIDNDVGSIAQRLKDIDSRLCLRANLETGVFVVYAKENDDEYLVSTYAELDGRVVREAERYASEKYDYVAHMEEIDAAADREKKHREAEVFGEIGEQLGHAVRKDLGYDKDRVFISDGKNSRTT